MPPAEKLAILVRSAGEFHRRVKELDELEPGLGDALVRWLLHREALGLEIREPTVEELKSILPRPSPRA